MKAMKFTPAIDLFLLCVFLFCASLSPTFAGPKTKAEDTYSLYVPDAVPIENLQVFYYLNGSSNGFIDGRRHADGTVTLDGVGGFPQKPSHEGKFNILRIETRDAKILEGVVYCPGFQTALFYEPSLATSSSKTELAMEALPMLTISGKIEYGDLLPEPDCVVDIDVFAYCGLSHVSNVDRPVPRFHTATVPIAKDGRFSANIHDLLGDSSFQQRDQKLLMTVLVRSVKTHNILQWLSSDPKDVFGNFPVQHAYPRVVTFYASKGPFKTAE